MKRAVLLLIMFLFTLMISSCGEKYKDLDLTMYQYQDTKNLVRFVYNAAKRVEKNGMKSIDYFKNDPDFLKNKNSYLYIYDMNGINVYHSGMKELEGTDLFDVVDKNGKKITRLALSALENKNNPHAWVHYSWWESGKFYPIPKSSCHFKVITPDGKELFVGAGLNYPQEEKEFVRIIVDTASELIKKKGQGAIAEIADPISQYNYRDVSVFVFRSDGEILISPVLNKSLFHLNLLECADEVGHKPFIKALKVLETADRAWEVFMAKNRYKRELVKKCLYIRKSIMAEENILVGAITDLPQPPY
ncbi:MAG: cache domain-containing protein [Candidatus Delongbacteria bacterium]|nr:cache domain-containing protein [Candidatus Delongbacteria bacterium]